MTEKRKPSLVRMIQSDYLVLLGILIPVVSLIMYIAVAYFGYFPGLRGHDPIQGSDGAPLFLYLFLGGLVIGVPLAIWRIRTIQQLFSTGIEVTAVIKDIYFQKDRGAVQYAYTYQGQEFLVASSIMKTNQTQKLSPGDQVILLIDPEQPKRALIRDLYI